MKHKSENKICQNCKGQFVIEPDDFGFYEKMKVPAPTNCPTCRQQQRMLFRNFKTLYKRPSDKSGKMIISNYNPDVPFPVWGIGEWWADDWEAITYAMDLDISLPFLEQLNKLFNKVPHYSLMNTKSENCGYSNMTWGSKNCYFIFGCVEDENCDYGHIVWNSTDCVDNLYVYKCELCYECIDCVMSNKLLYSQECESCVDSIGLYDCRDCVNCIGCVGLRHKSYHIFNKAVTKKEYEEFLQAHPLAYKESIAYILSNREKLRKEVPARPVFGSHNNNVTGDHIYNARNVKDSFDIKGGENSKYCYTSGKLFESYDISFNLDIQHSYQALASLGSSNTIGTHLVLHSSYVYYSESCYDCKNLFGCFGLRKKEYCILNKQYTKGEYDKAVLQIIENLKLSKDWGNFFPAWMSPFGYNESIANEYMPLTKEEAIKEGFTWRDNIPKTIGQENCSYEELPKNPEMYKEDELLKKILKCESCSKNYHLISREIIFYKRMDLPIPSKCFHCRHQDRMNTRNPRVLTEVECASCGAMTQTTYVKEKHSQYKIYCEKCYQGEVY